MLMASSSSSSFFSGLRWILGFLFFFSSSSPPDPHCLFSTLNPNLKPNPNPNPKAPLLTDNVYRTAYHFQPPRNWMNDPNAPMYYNGIYHLFYQYNPNGSLWSHIMFWGHSVSTDLIHWTALDIALSPSISSDINGCWSGSVTFLPGNRPVILYTGLDTQCRQVQNVAYPKNLSDPFLREWVKPGYNPVIEPFDPRVAHLIRDPTTGWLEPDGFWRTVIGTVTGQDAVGHAILYRSRDFVNWVRAENPFHSTNGSGLWECLDFYPLEVSGSGGTERTKYVLKVSFYDTQHDHYTLGRSDAERDVFIGDDASSNDYRMWPTIDYGRFYASKTFFDVAKQRRILWAWSNESDTTTTDTAKGWAGIQTVPRVVSLDTDGRRLIQWPVEEIESLRRDRINLQDVELEKGSLVEIKGLEASQADVEVEFELPSLIGADPFDASRTVDPAELCREKGADVDGRIGPFGLLVLTSDNLEEHTEVYFRVFEAKGRRSYVVLMCTDQRRSSLITDFYKPVYGGFVDIDIKEDRKISLRTLIDHSVVESFGGGGRTCITSRVYPTLLQKGNTHLYAFNNGTETVKISELKAWNMAHARIN